MGCPLAKRPKKTTEHKKDGVDQPQAVAKTA